MDARETSAMTEASGLPNDQNGFENPLPGASGMRKQTDLWGSRRKWRSGSGR